MAVVAAPPSQGFQAELGSRVKIQRPGEAEPGRSWQSLPFSSSFRCPSLLKLQRECRVDKSGVRFVPKSWSQESLRVNLNADGRKHVVGALFSRPVSAENLEGGAFPAGFRGRLTGKIGTSWARHPPAFLVRASAVGDDGPSSEAAPEEDDIWAKSSLPPYFKEFARPPKEKFNWALLVGGLLFVFVMRKAIIAEIARWVLGSVAACGYIVQGSKIALAWTVDRYGEHLAIVFTLVGWLGLAFQDAYAFIIDMTPVGALMSASAWVSAVLSVRDVASTTVRESSGVYLVAGLSGLFAVLGLLPPSVLLLGLIVLAAFQRFVRKTDMVAAVTPLVAVLAAVGDPILKVIAFTLFLALAIRNYWKARNGRQEEKAAPTKGRQPLVLVLLMAFVGISVAANGLHTLHIKWLVG